MPFPLLLLKEDALGDALLDEYAVGVVGGIGPVDLYHEPLRTIADKLIANLLGALAPKLIVCDGSSVADLDSTHCHAKPLSVFQSFLCTVITYLLFGNRVPCILDHGEFLFLIA